MLYKMVLEKGSLTACYAEDLDWLKRVRWMPALQQGNGGMIVEVSSGKVVAQCRPAGGVGEGTKAVSFKRSVVVNVRKAQERRCLAKLADWRQVTTDSGHLR